MFTSWVLLTGQWQKQNLLLWSGQQSGRVTPRSLVSLPRGLRTGVGFPSPANQRVALSFHLPLIIFAKCLAPCLAQRKCYWVFVNSETLGGPRALWERPLAALHAPFLATCPGSLPTHPSLYQLTSLLGWQVRACGVMSGQLSLLFQLSLLSLLFLFFSYGTESARLLQLDDLEQQHW